MGLTPDRSPGPRIEEKLTLTNDGYTADNPGDVVFDGTSFKFRDSTGEFNPRTGGSGITEEQHEVLDTLVHLLDETNYFEVTRSAGKVVSAINWTNSGKTVKVREVAITRSAGLITQVDVIQYNGSGVESMRFTGVISRSGGKVLSIQWTKTVS